MCEVIFRMHAALSFFIDNSRFNEARCKENLLGWRIQGVSNAPNAMYKGTDITFVRHVDDVFL